MDLVGREWLHCGCTGPSGRWDKSQFWWCGPIPPSSTASSALPGRMKPSPDRARFLRGSLRRSFRGCGHGPVSRSQSNVMATNMKRCFDTLLAQVGNAPILVDIGASGKLPPGWDAIKEHSVYVGFDPDSREMREVAGTAFKRKIIVNKAVHPDTNARKISFNLTKSPFCSSVLGVDYKETRNWYFQDLFTLVSVAEVPCTTLEAALRSADVDHCDWLKIDAQGI